MLAGDMQLVPQFAYVGNPCTVCACVSNGDLLDRPEGEGVVAHIAVCHPGHELTRQGSLNIQLRICTRHVGKKDVPGAVRVEVAPCPGLHVPYSRGVRVRVSETGAVGAR